MSDSEDSDFDPNGVVASEIDSVTAEEFHEQDAVPDHECSDVERPPARELPKGLRDRDFKKSRKSLDREGATGSNGAAARAPSAIKQSNDVGAGVEPKGKENSGAPANGVTVGVSESSLPCNTNGGGNTKLKEEKADVEKTERSASASVTVGKNDSNSSEKAENKDSKSSAEDGKKARSGAETEVSKVVAMAKAAAAAVTAKNAKTVDKSVDDLWKQMNEPVVRKQKRPASNDLGAWLQDDQPKKRVALPRLDEAAEKSAREKEEADQRRREEEEEANMSKRKKNTKVGTGLEAVLKAAKGGDDGPNTLDRTKEHWKEFKKTDAAIEEELEAHKKDKNRYTDRVQFLQRTEIREWEVEQAGKRSRR